MTREERFKITSNEFADIFVVHNRNEAIINKYAAFSLHIMNDRFAIAYLPVEQINEYSIRDLGYAVFPSSYGLCSERSLEVSGVERIREAPSFNLLGEGVTVGIIDTGIDYTHPAFLNADGTSRISSIWDQTIDSEDQYPEGIFYGTVYTKDQINQALSSETPFDIVPSRDEIGHGTMLAGVAAGSILAESNFSGVVPNAELIVVKLKQAKPIQREIFVIPEDVPCYQENDIMWGIQYVIQAARSLNRPVSICLGLGSSQGPHDGRDYLSSHVSVGADFPGVTITIAAGNEGNSRRHYFGIIDPVAGYNTVELNVGENENGFSMELWGNAPATYSIDITSPSGETVPRIAEGLQISRQISFVFEETVIYVDYKMVENQSGDQLILLRFRNPTPGIWTFQVYGRGNFPGSFHIWLPIDDFISSNTYFIQSNPYTTITAPGTALVPITVTAYNPVNRTLYENASRGYTRINVIKPELAAPGVNILGPNLEQGFSEYTGTGAAAAHTAGICAMILEWGNVRGNYFGIDSVEIKKFLIRGAQRSARQLYPNRDWGYGMIDIFEVFNVLRLE